MTAGAKAYREFLRSGFWLELSARKKEKVGRCERCKARDRLQCHHILYRSDWYESVEDDLIVLCRRCHAKEHGKLWDPFLSRLMVYRGDWLFSVLVYRMDRLCDRVTQGRPLRERDERFLNKAVELYPPDPTDTCMAFKAGHVRDLNRKCLEGVYTS